MAQPTPDPLSPDEAPAFARDIMRKARFPTLATMDGDQPRVRPISPVRTQGFTVYVANLRSYRKTAQIAANPRVELCYVDDGHNQVRITGVAYVEQDQTVLGEIWAENNLLRAFLRTPDNPELVVYRIEPERVICMKEWALSYVDVPISNGSTDTGDR